MEANMPSYAVVQLIETDADTLATYRQVAGTALEKHGGAPLAGGPGSDVLEDFGAGSTANVIITFPNADAARAWINDPELADIHALRRKGAKTTITLLPEMK